LEGRAVFSGNFSFSKLQNAIESVLQEAEWSRLSIAADEESWQKTTALNGSFETALDGALPPSYSAALAATGKLWAIALLQESETAILYVKFHHCLADAHSFALFWEACRNAYKNALAEKMPVYFFDEPTFVEAVISDINKTPAALGLGSIRRKSFRFNNKRVLQLKEKTAERQVDFQSLLLFALQAQLKRVETLLAIPIHIGVPLRNRASRAEKQSFLCAINFLPLPQENYAQISELSQDLRKLFRYQQYPLLQWIEQHKKTNAFNVLFSYQKESYLGDWDEGLNCKVEFLPTALDENLLGIHVLEYEGSEGIVLAVDSRSDMASEYFWDKCAEAILKSLIHWYFFDNWDYQPGFHPAVLQGKKVETVAFWAAFDQANDEATALICNGESLSFAALKTATVQRASELSSLGEAVVPLPPIRNSDNIISLLALWHLGKTVCFESEAELPKAGLEGQQILRQVPQYAYRARTSGTSGQQKEILIGSKGLCLLRADWQRRYQSDKHSVHLSLADQRFDVFMGDVLRSILSGQCLVLANAEERLSPTAISTLIQKYRVTHVETTPSVLSTFFSALKNCPSLQVLICGSEILSPTFAKQLRQEIPASCKLFNSYGLTETSIDSACFEIPSFWDADFMPAGLPLGEQILELRLHDKTAPLGIWGELWIGGEAVGFPCSEISGFVTENGLRYYKTGDKAMILPTVGLVLGGRLSEDFIKLSGRRIPVQDILQSLSQGLTLYKIELLIHEEQALLFVESLQPISQIESFLQKHFSSYQLPDQIIAVGQWPINQNGKTDRLLLIESYKKQQHTKTSWLANTKDEFLVANCLQKIGKPIGQLHDNFIRLGWNSIDLIRLANELMLNGIVISANKLLQSPTIATILANNTAQTNITDKGISLSDDDFDDILSVLND
jgi:acyl-CoA synthetase (AMP-forming)/AMP-acid ligase II/aryl carrier-like protein